MYSLFKKRIYYYIIYLTPLIFLLSFAESSKAQLGRGCYVSGVLYTANTPKGNRHFYRTSGVLINGCGYTPTGNSNNCRLYDGGNINNNSSYTLYNGAFSNDWAEINCPIDRNVWFLIIPISLFSVFKLKFSRKSISF